MTDPSDQPISLMQSWPLVFLILALVASGLTLIFGLLANLFTAVFVSRVIFDAVLSRKGRGEALSI